MIDRVDNKHRKIDNVLLVGGTHGNELTGIHLVQQWQSHQRAQNYPLFELDFLLANPLAIEQNRRYLDHDLNRCFKLTDLDNPDLLSHEQQLAKSINRQYGPKLSEQSHSEQSQPEPSRLELPESEITGTTTKQSKTDFIIDLHTSTANMQTNIVLIHIDEFHLQLAAYLKQQLDDVVITCESKLMKDHHFLESISPKGIVIEVGPIAQGSLEYPCYEKTEQAVIKTLDFISLYNSGNYKPIDGEIELFSYYAKLHFPKDRKGQICALVHPRLVGEAYPKIEPGESLFVTFEGEDVAYQGESTHLAFINEAAYYDQDIALCLCQPISYQLVGNTVNQSTPSVSHEI